MVSVPDDDKVVVQPTGRSKLEYAERMTELAVEKTDVDKTEQWLLSAAKRKIEQARAQGFDITTPKATVIGTGEIAKLKSKPSSGNPKNSTESARKKYKTKQQLDAELAAEQSAAQISKRPPTAKALPKQPVDQPKALDRDLLLTREERAVYMAKQQLAEQLSNKNTRRHLDKMVNATAPSPDLYGMMYRHMGWTINYTYAIIERFPKVDKMRVGLSNDIKELVNKCMHQVLAISSYNPFNNREEMLRELSVDLKMVNVLIRVAYKQRLITAKNLETWTGKVSSVDNIAIGLAVWLEGERKKRQGK